MAYENIDQAVVEFEAKLGYDILSLSWEANMNKLPKTANAILLIPCHTYLYTDHSKKKGAITHRAETNGEYEISSNYFTDCGGYDSHITVAKSQWRERRIELLTDLDKFKAWVKDTDDNWRLLGECSDVTENEIIHVDFMTEIQYNVMDLPAFDWTYNKQIT